jgi:hypothetical protein
MFISLRRSDMSVGMWMKDECFFSLRRSDMLVAPGETRGKEKTNFQKNPVGVQQKR